MGYGIIVSNIRRGILSVVGLSLVNRKYHYVSFLEDLIEKPLSVGKDPPPPFVTLLWFYQIRLVPVAHQYLERQHADK